MYEPILANYTPDGDEWTVEVRGKGQTLTATARGLIAARDRAEQLVDKIAQGDKKRTVVHTLNGDAVDFTAAYLSARLGLTDDPADTDATNTIPPQPTAPSEPASQAPPPAAMA
ncbi:hypothetical protein V5P93_001329 [Actinokineospora auranticolor]|uniref:Uncharacterized protein n=1 Tax=Actinokineospora auranticolor TaxID=155976 RepID=A0A2S6GUN9_9PSEU|nr:hypothetical protein [Actinokineospora auranticolor]PPK68958.1 hypothetical protein CLV40_104203 [Actinokineospora auranticolor]